MNVRSGFATYRPVTCMVLVLLATGGFAQSKPKKGYLCLEPNPQSLCNAANTCGSTTTPCTVDVRRGGYGASATASIQNPKDNAIFCLQSGTKVIFTSTQKNVGFVLDFGPDSPFNPPDAIVGGARAPLTATAEKAGCYKFSVGACISGVINGMCRPD